MILTVGKEEGISNQDMFGSCDKKAAMETLTRGMRTTAGGGTLWWSTVPETKEKRLPVRKDSRRRRSCSFPMIAISPKAAARRQQGDRVVVREEKGGAKVAGIAGFRRK